MDDEELIEDFYGVYLLYCMNPKYKGRTYIGYTTDPYRRIKQHNKGAWAGGARRTSNRGPWKMVMIIHGFPNNIAALRFEWAWQNPERTTRLHHVKNLKKLPRKENVFQYQLRILSEMLRVGPWNRLPLYVRWLDEAFAVDFVVDKQPPIHMPICFGKVKSKRLNNYDKSKKSKSPQPVTAEFNSPLPTNKCVLCKMKIDEENTKITCIDVGCELVCHITCLANEFLENGEYIPIDGNCPLCHRNLLWGDLIRKMKGCTYELDYAENYDNVVDDDMIFMSQDQNVPEDLVVSDEDEEFELSQRRRFDNIGCTLSDDDDD